MRESENKRLKFLISHLGYPTQKAFADAIGIKGGSLSDILREKDGVGVSGVIKKMLEILHNINVSWLETGEGDMFLKREKLPKSSNLNASALKDELISILKADKERLLADLEEKKQEINSLKKEIDRLMQKNK